MEKKFSVNDVHLAGIAEEFDRLTEEDLEGLLNDRSSFIDTGCPACHGKDVPHVFEHQTLQYRRCDDCELLYISPAPSEAQHLDYVIKSTAMSFWREQMPEEMKRNRRPMYVERVQFTKDAMSRLGVTPRSGLEIGAGNGEFAEELLKVMPLELLTLLEPQELNLDLPNIEIIPEGFDALEKLDARFDFVVAFELIEHLLEPDSFLKLLRGVLKPGAPLILSTPNEKSVETRGLGTDSSNILFDHVRLYNPVAMTKMLERNGFKVVEIHTPGKLDVERLKRHLEKKPDAFADQPALHFALTSGPETEERFQSYLVENLLSSHMRVVAVPDGEWNGGTPPVL